MCRLQGNVNDSIELMNINCSERCKLPSNMIRSDSYEVCLLCYLLYLLYSHYDYSQVCERENIILSYNLKYT